MPLDRLIGSAVVVDVVASSEQNPDYQVSVGDLEAWEKAHGAIPANAILLVKTGFSTRWPDAAWYLGTADRGPFIGPTYLFKPDGSQTLNTASY